MRIGYVVEPYEEKNASGMGYLVVELAKHMIEQYPSDEFTLYATKPIAPSVIPGAYRQVRIPKNFLLRILWFRFMKADVDVILFNAPFLPLVVPKAVKAVMSCQELASHHIHATSIPAKLFNYLRDQVLMPVSVKRAASIVTAAQVTKDDVLHFYRERSERVEVIPDGFQDLATLATGNETLPSAPYFFFTGKVKPRKNVHGIVAAFIAFKQRVKSDCTLVIAGSASGAYADELKQTIAAHGLADAVRFMGYVETARLATLFRGSLAFVFPSLSEGFGMPILEAMSLSTPVITSNHSSMPEVAGDAALLVDARDPQSIASAMERIYTDAGLREKLSKLGPAQAAKFSWARCAREYRELLARLA